VPVVKGDKDVGDRNNSFRQLVIMHLILEHCGGRGIGYRRKAEVKLTGRGGNSGEADFFAVNIKDGVEGPTVKKGCSQ